jgi:hypothetical protein
MMFEYFTWSFAYFSFPTSVAESQSRHEPVGSFLSAITIITSLSYNIIMIENPSLLSLSSPLSTFMSTFVDEKIGKAGHGMRRVELVSDNAHSHIFGSKTQTPAVPKDNQSKTKENLHQHAMYRWVSCFGEPSTEETFLRSPCRSLDHGNEEQLGHAGEQENKVRNGDMIKPRNKTTATKVSHVRRKVVPPILPFMDEQPSHANRITDYTIASMAASIVATKQEEATAGNAPRPPRRKQSFSGGNRRSTRGKCISVRILSVHG